MRLILSEYLRTLRERDEFDRLLPDLALLMGYVPVAKPQTGPRQYGVDFAAVKPATETSPGEMLLFVIKQGDLGRRDWDNENPTSVRPSLNEVLDVYLNTYVALEHKNLQKTIVLATTGDLKQEIELNWKTFKEQNASRANFLLWNGDTVASLLEQHMLDEHIFASEDRAALRRALSLAGDSDYNFRDLHALVLKQLGLSGDGGLAEVDTKGPALEKAMRRVHLAAQLCAHWASVDGDTRQSLLVLERTLLWTWHRVMLTEPKERRKYFQVLCDMRLSYFQHGKAYLDALWPYLKERDAMVSYTRESGIAALVLFEHMGLLATLGLTYALDSSDDGHDSTTEATESRAELRRSAEQICDALCDLISKNTASASPRLDNHCIDITLAMSLLKICGRTSELREWLGTTALRLDFSYRRRAKFPISTDSLDDLVDSELLPADEALQKERMRASWTIATAAAACVLVGEDAACAGLHAGNKESYPFMTPQLWHPKSDWEQSWYFGNALEVGTSEAPFRIPSEADTLRQQIDKFLDEPGYEWGTTSTAKEAGIWSLDFMACRHHRTPVPPSFWYRCLRGTLPESFT